MIFAAARPLHRAQVINVFTRQPTIRFTLMQAQDEDWMADYMLDSDLRMVHFVPVTEYLREPQQYHHGRL